MQKKKQIRRNVILLQNSVLCKRNANEIRRNSQLLLAFRRKNSKFTFRANLRPRSQEVETKLRPVKYFLFTFSTNKPLAIRIHRPYFLKFTWNKHWSTT